MIQHYTTYSLNFPCQCLKIKDPDFKVKIGTLLDLVLSFPAMGACPSQTPVYLRFSHLVLGNKMSYRNHKEDVVLTSWYFFVTLRGTH